MKPESLATQLTGRCIRTAAMVDKGTNKPYCMRCYVQRAMDPDDHEMILKHYLGRGPFHLRCYGCGKNLATMATIPECSVCSDRIEVLCQYLCQEGINIDNINQYRIDHYDFTLKHVTFHTLWKPL
jgi:hypothetical protein